MSARARSVPEMGGAGALVSGLWSGSYDQGGTQHPQDATLEFADGLIRGDGRDEYGLFSIEGEYRADDACIRMGWIKTYENAHSVLYLGVLDVGAAGMPTGESIRGSWYLSGMTDAFELHSPLRAGAASAS